MSSPTNIAYCDAHIHLDMYEEAEVAQLLQRAAEATVTNIVTVSMNLASAQKNRDLARKHHSIFPAYGYHPEQPLPSETELSDLLHWMENLLLQGEKFAVGEVGLPYYTRTELERTGQLFDERPYVALLERFIQFAAAYQLPIALHAVYEDADKVLELLDHYRIERAHFHWFKGSKQTIQNMIDRQYYISITPDVACESEIQQLVRDYPLELMMTETDGPWPFEEVYGEVATHSAMVTDVVEHIARLKQLEPSFVRQMVYANAQRFYSFEK